jgi:hypothetical protein
MRHMSTQNTSNCLARGLMVVALAALGLGSGCALPNIEGIFGGEDFALFDDTPEARGQTNDRLVLVFLEHNDVELRTVTVELRNVEALPRGVPLEVGAGDFADLRPVVDVVQGTLVETIRDDGVRILSTTDDARRARSVSGTLTLDDTATVGGSFRADLDDGGWLQGLFGSAL